MQAAERIFEGQFDGVQDEGDDIQMDSLVSKRAEVQKLTRLAVCRIHTNALTQELIAC
jgi:hypothetical protein